MLVQTRSGVHRSSHLRIAAVTVAAVAILLPPSSLYAAEPQNGAAPREKVKGANDELERLFSEFKQADQKYVKLIIEVRPTIKSPEERKKFVVDNDPSLEFANRAFAIADQNPKTVVGVLSLRFVCGCGYTSLNQELIALKKNAIKRLEEDYVDEKWFWAFLPSIALETSFYDVKPFLRRCLEKSPHREIRGQACFHLADQTLRMQRALNERGQPLPEHELQQMMALFERCIQEFGDLPTADTTIAKAAERSLFEIRNLAVGKPAPKTVGQDLDGKDLDLADFRGRVVMLTFWGDWCGPCREMLPHHQALAERFQDRPFVLLGINSDPRDKAQEAVKREKITWRSWWDGGDSNGPIAAKWNVTAWPETYVLDHKGIIRFRYSSPTSDDGLAKSIDQLLLDLSKR
jgi:peroxiredoxin